MVSAEKPGGSFKRSLSALKNRAFFQKCLYEKNRMTPGGKSGIKGTRLNKRVIFGKK
ncbi:MAG: hypothetical protein H7A26_08830 [Spirochaetales bacterium]|nr:hypothetical protein [Spirochaetales bacterium]